MSHFSQKNYSVWLCSLIGQKVNQLRQNVLTFCYWKQVYNDICCCVNTAFCILYGWVYMSACIHVCIYIIDTRNLFIKLFNISICSINHCLFMRDAYVYWVSVCEYQYVQQPHAYVFITTCFSVFQQYSYEYVFLSTRFRVQRAILIPHLSEILS